MTMLNGEHTRAQDLASEAELLMKKGQHRKAQVIYAKAAAFEREALLRIEPSKVRTRGIIAVSAASLCYNARELAEAEQLLYCLLADPTYLASFRAQFKELLEVVLDEQALPPGTTYSGQEIWVSLRGGMIGSGTAPLDLALSKTAEVKNLVLRTAEYVAKKPLRRHGAAGQEIQSLIQARATQPSVGSYRFAIRLVEPVQADFFPNDKKVDAQAVSDALFGFIKTASSPSPGATQALRSLVPDDGYRRALVRLVKNVVPNKENELREVELTRVARQGADGDTIREPLLLFKGVRARLNEILRDETPPLPDAEVAELHGVLRAVHLDENWLIVVDDAGQVQRCNTTDDVLDDVVGPMVNRRVVVKGEWRVVSSSRRFLLREIELEGD